MATYLPGVQPFIPDYQPFQPDLNFYANALQTKQTQYDTNWKHLNDVYGKYFYADVLRPGDQEKKDKLIKDIDFELKRVSGLDLSLQQNLQQATQVFRPFYEDKTLMHDMAYTANFKQDRGAAMALKNNVDEKKAGKYWNEGIEFMDIMKDKYVNSSDEESLTMWSPEYTPYINAIETYTDLAKKLDIKADVVTPGAQWMVRQRNGDLIYEPLVNIFKSEYANNPGLQEVYKVQSVVNRHRSIKKYMGEDGLDAVGAERKYLQEQNSVIQTYLKTLSQEANADVKQKEDALAEANKSITNGSDNIYTESYKNSLEESEAYAKSVWAHVLKVKKQADDKPSSTVVTSQGVDPDPDLQTLAAKVDAGTAMMLANQDIADAAYGYSRKDMLVDYEANPFAVVNARHKAKMLEIAEKDRLDRQSALDAARLASNYYLQDLETGAIYKNPLYTTQKKISDEVITTDPITNIIADNEKATRDAFNSEAKAGLIVTGEYFAKMASKGQLPLAAMFESIIGDMSMEEAEVIASNIGNSIQKELDNGNISVPLNPESISAYYKVNPFGLKNVSSMSEDEVREFFQASDIEKLYYKPGFAANMYNVARKLAIDTRGAPLSQKYLQDVDQTGLSDYIALSEAKARVDQKNRDVLIKTLLSTDTWSALDILKNPELKKSIVESFVQKLDSNSLTAANSKIGQFDFVNINSDLIKNAIEKGLVPESVITMAGQSIKVKADRVRLPGVGYDLEGKSKIGNFSAEDLANVDKIYQKEYLKRLKDKGITYDPSNGLLTKFRVGRKGSKKSMGSDAAFVNSGKSEDAWAYQLFRTETGNIKDEISREYANKVNKLVEFQNNPEVALGTVYNNLSKTYAEAAQNTRELVSFSPQVYNKGNAYGVDGIYGIAVPLAVAGAEGTNLFVDAALKLGKLDFTSTKAQDDGYYIQFGLGGLQQGEKGFAGIGTFQGEKGMLILDALQGLVGVSAKGNTEKPKGMDINIGALAMGAFGDPNLGSITITGIDYDWLMGFTKRGTGETSSGGTPQIGVISESDARDVAMDGMHFVAPVEVLRSMEVFKNVELDPLERVLVAEGQLPTYYDPYNAGEFTIKENVAEGQPHVIQGSIQYIDEQGNWNRQNIGADLSTSKYNVSSMNKELKDFMLQQRLINEKTAKELKRKGISVSTPPELNPNR